MSPSLCLSLSLPLSLSHVTRLYHHMQVGLQKVKPFTKSYMDNFVPNILPIKVMNGCPASNLPKSSNFMNRASSVAHVEMNFKSSILQ